MKSYKIIGLILIAFIISGCNLYSVNPFYTNNQIVHDDSLIGCWNMDKRKIEQINQNIKNNDPKKEFWEYFRIVIKRMETEKPVYLLCQEVKIKNHEVRRYALPGIVFELAGTRLIDICFSSFDDNDHHFLVKYCVDKDKLLLYNVNEDWFKNQNDKGELNIEHKNVSDSEGLPSNIVLTAETVKLQEFLLNHINDIFDSEPEVYCK